MKKIFLNIGILLLVATVLAALIDVVAMRQPEPVIPAFNPDDAMPKDKTLSNTTWLWTGTTDARGQTVHPADPNKFQLTFKRDGTVTTTTDCNSAGGKYVTQDEVLSMGQFVSTEMFCEGSLEQAYMGGLATVNSYRITGDTMTMILHKDLGMMIFRAQ